MNRTKGLTWILGVVSGACGLVSLICFFFGGGSYSLMAAIADGAICYLSQKEADRERQILFAVFVGLALAEVMAFLAGSSFTMVIIIGLLIKLIGFAGILIYLGKISYDKKKPIIGGGIVVVYAIVDIIISAVSPEAVGGSDPMSIIRTILSIIPVIIISIMIATDIVKLD